jgi:hypothetical protein
MSPEAQRIAIAEACGWKYIRAEVDWLPQELTGHYTKPHPTDPEKEKFYCTRHSIPDYLNDLNAMHEAEKTCIIGVAKEPLDTLFRLNLWNVLEGTETDPIHANAQQRAEAFLKTLGLWK